MSLTLIPSLPDPRYLHRALPPHEAAIHQQFVKQCENEDISAITEFTDQRRGVCCADCLNEGLRAAIRCHRLDITAFLLDKNPTVSQGIAVTALTAKSLTYLFSSFC